MKIFAVADTHLSGSPPAKPMDIFGDHWQNHWNRIKTDWLLRVSDDDTVLIAGDISWGMKLADALPDLTEIRTLPGRIILGRGNHDYWWDTVTKMRKAVDDQLLFLHNNYHPVGPYAVCGSRGWICPDDPAFTDGDQPIYNRELLRIQSSLAAAKTAGYTRLILMLHYPPAFGAKLDNPLMDLIHQYSVEICIYGHIHDPAGAKAAPSGHIGETDFSLVACDALNFRLLQIV